MKKSLLIVLAYVLALVQLGASVYFPDLLMLLVITAAVFEERNFALVVGLLSGLFLDCGNPARLGSYMIVYLLVAYGVTLVRRLVYERVIYLMLFCVAALVLKQGLSLALSQMLPSAWQVLIANLLTVGLVIPVYRIIKVVFRYQWKVA